MSDSRELSREAGPELDAEIAERVMGWVEVTVEPKKYDYPHDGISSGWACFGGPSGISPLAANRRPHWAVPEYSRSISRAFSVVEAMRAKGWSFYLDIDADSTPSGNPCAMFSTGADHLTESSGGATPAEAICLAALKAIASSSEVSGS